MNPVKNILIMFLIAGLVPAAAMAQTAKKKHKAAPAAEEQRTERSGAVANEPDTDGCGLGWQVTDKKTIIASITRGTTNGVVPPSFGMTSGTLGCAQHPFAKKDQNAVIYALSNYEPLTIDMAQGSGEYLDAFARSMGCSADALTAFSHMTQSKFKDISEQGKATPVKLFINVKKQIQADPVLASACNV